MGFVLPLLAGLAMQGATDAQIDTAVATLKTSPNGENYTQLLMLAARNWPRVVWNYQKADGSLRSRILSAVHYAGSNDFVNPLLPLACEDPGWPIRQIGAMLVERIADNHRERVHTVEALQQKLAKDRAWQVRIVIASGLQWQYQPSAKPLLMKLTRDPHRFVRIQAAMSLGRLKDTRAIPLLIAVLDKQDGFYESRFLYNNGWGPENHLVEFGMRSVPAVLKQLKSKSAKQRQGALEVLIGMENLNVLANMKPTLFERAKPLATDPDPWVRYAALRAMAWNHNPDSIPYLIKALKDKAELAPNSPLSANVRNLLEYGPEVDSKPWPEGQAALKAAEGGGKLTP